jgi:hypothetical protein
MVSEYNDKTSSVGWAWARLVIFGCAVDLSRGLPPASCLQLDITPSPFTSTHSGHSSTICAPSHYHCPATQLEQPSMPTACLWTLRQPPQDPKRMP